MLVVVKIGTSSLTDETGQINHAGIAKIVDEVARLRAYGHVVVVVSSGAISAGLLPLGLERPNDVPTLQALAAVGQHTLMTRWYAEFFSRDLIAGQVLLARYDFVARAQYLHARQTLNRLLELGVVPVVNENDAVTVDEIRFGDNDRLAALVAHMLRADLLVLLTDTAGLYTGDPRTDDDATLIEEITQVNEALESVAGGVGTRRGSGGMASKLQAGKIAAWSGVRTVIAAAERPDVLVDAVAGTPVGTAFVPRERRLPARKLWIAFGGRALGTIVVDKGARRAVLENGTSLLPAGVVSVEGRFDGDDPVSIAGPDGAVFAKGLASSASEVLRELAGRKTKDLPADVPHEVVHRDNLVVLPSPPPTAARR